MITCSVSGCAGDHVAKGLCDKHYRRWRRTGHHTLEKTAPGDAKKFVVKVAETTSDDCILWPYSQHPFGYGQVHMSGRLMTAHRAVLVTSSGIDPKGMDAAHGPCHNPLCVNPKHLYWATRKDNLHDKVRDGTIQRGERAGGAKLTEPQVRQIRVFHAEGGAQVTNLAGVFRVHPRTIRNILRRDTWKHV